MWRNLTITLSVPENQTPLPGCFTPTWFYFLCGLWLSHHLSLPFPSGLMGMQNNTDHRNRLGLNLILSNREFKQLKRVTESICSKNGYFREKLSQDVRGKSSCSSLFTFTLPQCCCCPPLSHFPPFWKLLSILFLCVSLLLQPALSLSGCCSFLMLASSNCLYKAFVALHANS